MQKITPQSIRDKEIFLSNFFLFDIFVNSPNNSYNNYQHIGEITFQMLGIFSYYLTNVLYYLIFQLLAKQMFCNF